MMRYLRELRIISVLLAVFVLPIINGQNLTCTLSTGLGGAGYNIHPENCDQFIQCAPLHNPIVHSCPFGQFFSVEKLTCVKSEDANCPHDQCIGQADGIEFAMADHCRGFWHCLQSKSHAKCCNDGHSFQDSGGCMVNDSCTDECPIQESKDYEDPCSLFERDPSNPSRYLSKHPVNLGQALPCPPGTKFSETKCMCTDFVEVEIVNECQPVVYQATDGKLRGQYEERIYTPPSKVSFLSSDHPNTTLGKQSINFNGEDSITIWRLAQFDFQEALDIEMYLTVFSAAGEDPRVETVITNAFGESASPSIHIEIFRSQDPIVALMASLRTVGGQSQSVLTFLESGVPTRLILAYNGKDVLVYTSTDTDESLLHSPLTGNIELRQSAIILGSSSIPPSTLTNFHGTISELSIRSCLSDFTLDLFQQTGK